MRFVEGALPSEFSGHEQADSTTTLWVRDEPPRALDHASLAPLCECFFPRVFLRRHRPVPIGTVILTTSFHADEAMLAAQGDHPVLSRARALNFRNGYFDQAAQVWSDRGELLARSHQRVCFRE